MKVSEVNEIVTAKVLEALDAGTVPWHMPWATGLPVSMSTGKPYRGINTMLLGMSAMAQAYSSPWWGTYDKIAELSGFVKTPRKSGKGSWWAAPADDPERRILKEEQKSTKVYYWEVKRRKDPDSPNDRDKDHVWLFATVHSVFNAEQAACLPEKYTTTTERAPLQDMPESSAAWDRYITDAGPAVRFGGSQAYYDMSNDRITVPADESYESTGELWSTRWHEAGHSSGHPKRLKRQGIEHFDHFASDKYSREELVAEMTAVMLCAMLGIDDKNTFDNSASYINHWRNKISGEDGSALVVTASRQAQKAVDHILGITYENGDSSLCTTTSRLATLPCS
jgi:antirestriction protein ArdC